ncbi:MAG: hypothetical protein Tsb0019_30200 [Roseibium sp.]
MISLSIRRPFLTGLVLVAFQTPIHAQTVPLCADDTQAPAARSAACRLALETVTEPEVRAQLLVNQVQSQRLQPGGGTAADLLASLEEAEQLLPATAAQSRADLLVERAEVRALSNEFDAAFADLKEAEGLAPGDADPLVSRAQFNFVLGNEAEGAAELDRALAVDPDHVRTLYLAMRQAQFTGRTETCIAYGNRALAISPRDTRVLGARARCFATLGLAEAAQTDIDRIDALGAWAAVAADDVALAYMALDRPAAAARAAHQSVRLDPLFEDGYFDLVWALMAAGEHDAAIETFRIFKETGLEDRIGISNGLAWELYLAGRYEDALKINEEWRAENPDPVDAPNTIANESGYPIVMDTAGHTLAALGRQQEAVSAFLLAAKLSPAKVRTVYQQRLADMGFGTKLRDGGLEEALSACVATGDACRLYTEN